MDMERDDFSYAPVCDAAGLPVAATILAESDCARAQWGEDAAMAGLSVAHCGSFAGSCEAPLALGAVVLLDIPAVDARGMAALARLDTRVARSGARLIVTTTFDALDTVFACLDQCGAEILVDPSSADRVMALGRAMIGKPRARLRELAEDERLTLFRLTEQVAEIAGRLERLGQAGLGGDGGAFRFESPRPTFKGDDAAERSLLRRASLPLPDPRMVRRLIVRRQARARYFDGDLFADPAWDMLLDLTAARAEGARVSVTSLCIAAQVPSTTALRWIRQMIDAGLFERVEDSEDRRRAFIALSDKAAEAMARYFAEAGRQDVAG